MTEVQLPSEGPELREFAIQACQEIERLKKEVLGLQQQLLIKNKYLFGKRTEKLGETSQLPLLTLPEGEGEKEELGRIEIKAHSRSHQNGRTPLPADVPRQKVFVEPEEIKGRESEFERLGEEISEILDYKPASFYIWEVVRGKYKELATGNILIGKIPAELQPLAKGRPAPGLLAQVLVSKYCDHQPLNRQEEIYERHGVHIARSTLCDWVQGGADLLAPLAEAAGKEVLTSYCVKSDDTPVVEQDRESQAYFWGYHSRSPALVYYQYALSRSGDVPVKYFEGYQGYVQADAYRGYDKLFKNALVKEVGCWAHARRKFVECESTAKARCQELLKLISKLYAVEAQAKTLRQRLKARIKISADVLKTILAKLHNWSLEELPESPFGKAMQYCLNNWKALTRYVYDPHLDIDNNSMERLLRPLAVGRKNWMFTGSKDGGHSAAIIYTLINSCKLNKVDPYAYLVDVIGRLSTKNYADISDLLPNRWRKN